VAKASNWVTAIHEAGHVAVCLALGGKCHYVTIVPWRGFLGHAKTATGDYEKQAIISFAGQQAELVFKFNTRHVPCSAARAGTKCSRDLDHADQWIRWMLKSRRAKKLHVPVFEWNVKRRSLVREWRKKMRVTKEEVLPHAVRLTGEARRLVRKHRSYIERLAKLLIEKRTLEESDIPVLESKQKQRRRKK